MSTSKDSRYTNSSDSKKQANSTRSVNSPVDADPAQALIRSNLANSLRQTALDEKERKNVTALSIFVLITFVIVTIVSFNVSSALAKPNKSGIIADFFDRLSSGKEASITVASSDPTDSSAELNRTIALLDLTQKNGESSTSTQALAHSLEVAGVPFTTTQSVSTAIQYGFIFSSSYIGGSTLAANDKERLKNFVRDGGVLVAASATDPALSKLFGTNGFSTSSSRKRLNWQTQTGDQTLKYFDDPNEITISLGGLSQTIVINTKGYLLGGADSLANFEDGRSGVMVNEYGSGKAYNLGFSYTDLVTRNQLDNDYKAERTYAGGFEPTSDTIYLFLRSVYESGQDNAVWKFTSPGDSRAAVILTHDVDSTSGMVTMGGFASMEAEHDAIATYNITTHYIKDKFAGDFYSAYIPQMQDLIARGQKIGSHSVGHFRDFNNETTFPIGAPGNTRSNYTPYNNGTFTTGGTVYGELEVSKELLENDVGATIKTFRSGHLSYNDKQANVLESLGYLYDSSFSANDVLTNFPYLFKKDRKLSGAISNIYEIPVTFSDVGITEANYASWVDGWLDVTERNAANNAPSVLLVHPNRTYKITAQDLYLDQLGSDIKLMDMDAYGDYWRERAKLDVRTSVNSGVMTIRLSGGSLVPADEGVGLVIDNGTSLQSIEVFDAGGDPVNFSTATINSTDILIYAFNS